MSSAPEGFSFDYLSRAAKAWAFPAPSPASPTGRSCSLASHDPIAAGPRWLCQQYGWQRRGSLHRGAPTNL